MEMGLAFCGANGSAVVVLLFSFLTFSIWLRIHSLVEGSA
jgi:hypothetical protein